MSNQSLLKELIQNLCCLPGVGHKSAQRMAFHLLQRNREGGLQLSAILAQAMQQIGYCSQCRTLSEAELCGICADTQRDEHTLCVVESAADVWILEQATHYTGRYFVLHGRLSPLDGIGPEQLGIDWLEQRMSTNTLQELILATNSTVESQATAHFIAELASKHHIHTTRIAHGIPMGGELEFIDSGTLSHAFKDRRTV